MNVATFRLDASDAAIARSGVRAEASDAIVMRCALGVIFLWFGAMKFTSYEATGIAPFIMNSPLVGWWHSLLGIQRASYLLGVFEITTGILLALHRAAPRAAVWGGVMAVVTFLITLSFLLTAVVGISSSPGYSY